MPLLSLCFWTGHADPRYDNLPLDTADHLQYRYYHVFPTGNRNAASHLWAAYIMHRAGNMTSSTFENVFKGFCPVSGSPTADVYQKLYKLKVEKVDDKGSYKTGTLRHCCWPCICDSLTHLYTDTLTVHLKSESRQYDFLVIGDPCVKPNELLKTFKDPFDGRMRSLSQVAPNVRCVNNKLEGALYSDNGYPIIGMLFTDDANMKLWEQTPQAGLFDANQPDDRTFGWGSRCEARMKNGMNSGMGLIFHLVASINPIQVQSKALPTSSTPPAKLSELDVAKALATTTTTVEPPTSTAEPRTGVVTTTKTIAATGASANAPLETSTPVSAAARVFAAVWPVAMSMIHMQI